MSARNRLLIALSAVGALVAIAVGVGVALLFQRASTGPTIQDDVLAIPTVADLYPTNGAKPFSKPERCGLDKASLDKLLAGGGSETSHDTGCMFHIDYGNSAGMQGSLSVEFTDGEGNLANAMSVFDVATGQGMMGPPPGGPMQQVTGLGDEAAVGYDASGGFGRAELNFRAGTVNVHVVYMVGSSKDFDLEPLGEKRTVDNALEAGAEVAVAIGAKVDEPKVGAPAKQEVAALPLPDPCKLLGAETLRSIGVSTTPDESRMPSLPPLNSASSRSCTWSSDSDTTSYHSVSVKVSAFPEGKTHDAPEEARRQFTEIYDLARKSGQKFYALRGPGEQAVGTYQAMNGPQGQTIGYAEVSFVVRNLVVELSVWSDGKLSTEAAALNRAHFAAEAVAAALPK